MLHTPLHPAFVTRTIALLLLGALASCGGSGGGGGGGGVAPGGGVGQGADLTPTNVTMTGSGLTAGDSFTVTDTIENRGTGTATGFQVGVYLSTDAFVDVTDVLLGFRTIGTLAAGMSSTGGGSLTVPLATPSGNYFVGAIADDLNTVPEADEGNNLLVASAPLPVTAAPLPELSVTDVSYSPVILDAGDSLQVTESIVNNGTLSASGVVVAVYLSADSTITSADILLGFRTLASLDIAEGSIFTGSLTVPSNIFAGAYFVGVVVDDGDANVESNETNNTLVAPFKLQVNAPPRPDLTPSGLSFAPNTVDAGQTIQISEAILNQGAVDAGPFRVGIYLSVDSVITTADTLIAARTLPGLAQGVSSTVSGVTAMIPPETSGGVWNVGIFVDDLGSVVEDDEGNNGLAAFGTLTVTVPPAPDTIVTSLSFTPGVVTPALGDQVTFSDTVKNQGVVAAGAFRVGFYLSSNPVVSSGDILLGSRMINGLAVGDSSTGNTVVTLPAGLGPGSYFVGAITDDESVLTELFITNNVFTAPSPIDVVAAPMPMPQLKAESVSFSPGSVSPGGGIQIEDIVRNVGTISASQFRVGLYLSLDETIDGIDIKVGERVVSNLPINFGSAASAPYTVPLGTPPGSYRVGVFNDLGYDIAESDESDNILIAVGFLTVN